jgi:hypothetical protein
MREIVTADDVDTTVAAASDLFATVTDEQLWHSPARDLDWTCWETVDHVSDDLFAYACQLSGTPLATDRYLPFGAQPRRPGGPRLTTYTEPSAGLAGLLGNLDACGALLSAMVRTAPPQVRGYHPGGVSDAEGFAAMGVLEVVIHARDIAVALDLEWVPPDALAGRVLDRLFPNLGDDLPEPAPEVDRWHTLLWAAGRVALPGVARREGWRWYSEPLPSFEPPLP